MLMFVGEGRESFVSVVRAGAGRREEELRARLVQKERSKARKESRDDDQRRRALRGRPPNICHSGTRQM